MKSKRQEKILELIAQYAIETQEELLERLSECGIPSTQATVSRDADSDQISGNTKVLGALDGLRL